MMQEIAYHHRVSFFDAYASDMHPSFREEMARQLMEKGAQTGIKAFEKQELMLMVGLRLLDLQLEGKRVKASIDFIVPPAWSFPVHITWESTAEATDLLSLHQQEVQDGSVVFNWAEGFPLETISPFFKPYKVKKANKSGWGFDVEYYRHMFPDLTFELYFREPPSADALAQVNGFFRGFMEDWNAKKPERAIQFMGEAEENGDHYALVMDLGRDNTDRLIGVILKAFAGECGEMLRLIKVT